MSAPARTQALRPVEHPARLVVPGVAGVVLVLLLGVVIRSWPPLTAWDTSVLEALGRHRTSGLTAVAKFLAWLFNPSVAITLTVAIALLVWALTRSWERATVFTLVVFVGWLATQGTKFLIQRPRPELSDPIVATPTSFSYPSGHTAIACSLAVAVVFTLRDWSARWTAITAGALVVIAVAWSRLYLGVHYVTDVCAATILTVAVAGILIPLTTNVLRRR